MRVAREVALAVPAERVWEALWDVPRMVGCMPGCVEAREVEPRRHYQARMSQRVGPIALSVPLDIRVTEESPGRLALEARGRDSMLAAEGGDALDVDDVGGAHEPRLHQEQQLGAPGVEHGVGTVPEQRRGLGDRRWPVQLERAKHASAPDGVAQARGELVDQLLGAALDDAGAERAQLAEHASLRLHRQPAAGLRGLDREPH